MMVNKISKIVNSFHALVRIGSGKKLFAFDVFVWIVIFADLIAIKKLHLDIYHFSYVDHIWQNFSIKYIGISAAIIYTPPILSSLINFLFRDSRPFKKNLPTRSKNTLFIFHFITAVTLSYFISISNELQQLSGFKIKEAASSGFFFSSFEYTPTYYLFIKIITKGTIAALILKLIASLFASKIDLLREFKLWFNLSDISREYFPQQKGNLIFVNTASMAPAIAWINIKEEVLRNWYEKTIPTSKDARNYLIKTAEKSRELLRQYLFRDYSEKSDFSIEFFPGTSRALEVGLSQIKNLNKIILSPYEHPSQYDVVKWFTNIKPSIQHKMLDMDYSKLESGWQEQKNWLINLLDSELSENKGKKVAILISEVHYFTGLYINVKEIIDSLRLNHNESSVVFIVDGSQSVGNLLKPFYNLINSIREDDFYYFSAHKWLLSPNTCGVLIAEQKRERYNVMPYDVFYKSELPTSTIEPGLIFGIYSSLNYLITDNMYNLIKFSEKSKLLKSYFKDKIGERIEIIESSSDEMNESNFISIRPSRGYKWKDNDVKQFWKEISKTGTELTVIDLTDTNEHTWWLRISFPYFLQIHLIKQLIKHLNNRVISIN